MLSHYNSASSRSSFSSDSSPRPDRSDRSRTLATAGFHSPFADFPSPFSDLQTIVGLVIFLLSRSVVLFALDPLVVGAHLPAGALRLIGGDVVAVASVYAST